MMPPGGRTPLPSTVDGLPPLGEAFEAVLTDGLLELGCRPDDAVLEAIRDHARLMLAWGRAINLTAIRQPADVARLHVLDSLTARRPLSAMAPPRAALLDLGSGPGYPGLPLALTLPAGRLALVESVAKKARFLRVAASAVTARLSGAGGAPPSIEVHAARAEALAAEGAHRGAWDIVTARAVGSLAEVLELALPLLRVGGCAVTWKRDSEGGSLRRELAEAAAVGRAAGGDRAEVLDVGLASLSGHRLVIVRKSRRTPARFPRPSAGRRA